MEIITVNAAWNLLNFRAPLLRDLLAARQARVTQPDAPFDGSRDESVGLSVGLKF